MFYLVDLPCSNVWLESPFDPAVVARGLQGDIHGIFLLGYQVNFVSCHAERSFYVFKSLSIECARELWWQTTISQIKRSLAFVALVVLVVLDERYVQCNLTRKLVDWYHLLSKTGFLVWSWDLSRQICVCSLSRKGVCDDPLVRAFVIWLRVQ